MQVCLRYWTTGGTQREYSSKPLKHLKSSSEQIFSENWRWVPLNHSVNIEVFHVLSLTYIILIFIYGNSSQQIELKILLGYKSSDLQKATTNDENKD